MEYVEGRDFYEYVSTKPTQEARNAFGEKIWRCWARLFRRGKMYYSDLHPGNFLFAKDGRLGFLDFGCILSLDGDDWEHVQRASRAMRSGYEDQAEYVKTACLMSDQEAETKKDFVNDLVKACQWCWEPYLHDGHFDFSSVDYLRRGVDLYGRVMRTGQIRQLPVLVFLNRGVFAATGLLHRLGAQVPSKAISEEEETAL